jgi:hypothetical protein
MIPTLVDAGSLPTILAIMPLISSFEVAKELEISNKKRISIFFIKRIIKSVFSY